MSDFSQYNILSAFQILMFNTSEARTSSVFCLFTPADINLKKEKRLPQGKQQFFSVAGEPGR
jgi:hypothetical protein